MRKLQKEGKAIDIPFSIFFGLKYELKKTRPASLVVGIFAAKISVTSKFHFHQSKLLAITLIT
jgi:hypothetical protein